MEHVDVNGKEIGQLIQNFIDETANDKILAIDQLLNAIFLVTAERTPEDGVRQQVQAALLRPLNEDEEE